MKSRDPVVIPRFNRSCTFREHHRTSIDLCHLHATDDPTDGNTSSTPCAMPSRSRPTRPLTGSRSRLTLIPSVLAVTFAAVVLMGCANGLERIDRRVDRMLTETTQEIGAGQTPAHVEPGEPVPPGVYRDPADERPSTVNPPADALSFNEAAIRDAEEVMERLETYNEKPIDAIFPLRSATRRSTVANSGSRKRNTSSPHSGCSSSAICGARGSSTTSPPISPRSVTAGSTTRRSGS
jgi:hypothetical protein